VGAHPRSVAVCLVLQVRINYANPDMVGHTGDLKASIHACATVDKCLKELLEVCDEMGGR
jgi:2,3-bisphosphoglycerate-independent phosphoglycerate mutase